MDKSFEQMAALLQAVWPAISTIDWSNYCGQRVSAYDDSGVPKYTGLLMHRSGVGCVGATTVTVGFLPRPEKSATIVAGKTELLEMYPLINASIEARQPDMNLWGGGVRSNEHSVGYGITGLPEIGDHLLVSQMMREYKLLTNPDWKAVVDPETEHMVEARAYVDMSVEKYNSLKRHIFDIVSTAAVNLQSAA